MLSAAVLAFAGMASVNAEMIKAPLTSEVVMFIQDKTPIEASNLPDDVKKALAGDEYAGWTVKEAFAVKPAEGVGFFEISLQKDDEIRVVNLDEAGKVIELPVTTPSVPVPSEEPTPSEKPTPTENPTPVPSEVPTPSEEPAPSE